MDIASILEEYLADISTLPGDVSFILDEIKVNDEKLLEVQRRIAQRDGAIQKYVQANGATPEFGKEQAFYPKIRSDYQECISLQQEKYRLAAMGLYLVTKHVSKLDTHVAALEAEGVLPPPNQDLDESFSFHTSNVSISNVSHHGGGGGSSAQSADHKRKMTNDAAARRTSRAADVSRHQRNSSSSSHAGHASSHNSRQGSPNVGRDGHSATSGHTASSGNSHSSSALTNSNNVSNTGSERDSVEHNGARISLKRASQQPRPPPTEEGDESFCFCKKGSVGNMIACDGDTCDIEWFHWDCVGLTEDPQGSWYCPSCKEKIKRQR